MDAREGDGDGEDAESEHSSRGGVVGATRAFVGTDLERNLGMGRADGAGEAWKVGPAYAPCSLAGVAAACVEHCSASAIEAAAKAAGETRRSTEDCDNCFLALREPVGMVACSLDKTALSARPPSPALAGTFA